MRLRTIIAALSLPALLLPLGAAEVEPTAKQSLQYGVEWRLIRAGVARLSWSPQPGNAYQAELHMESAGLVSKLYRVNDNYRAMVNANLCAENVLLNAEEGKRRRETRITFDPAGKVNYLERDLLKNTVVLSKEIETPSCVHEYMGGLTRLRGLRLDVGQSAQIPLTDGKKFAQVRVEAQEREQVKTPAGTFTAIRHEVFLFNNVIVNRKARMYVWLTDDAVRLPVQLRVRLSVLVGTITLQLERFD